MSSQLYAPRPVPAAVHYYPPQGGPPGPASVPLGSSTFNNKEGRTGVDHRSITRTPSPTPSEAEALSGQKPKRSLKQFLDPEYLKNPRNLITVIITLVVIAALIAFIVLQDKILDALSPASNWLRETPGAWAIPIGIMIILSFPPLFGHELVAIFCGDVWGVWIGFGIVAAGTILGELVTYFTFRYCCTSRAKKMEATNLKYALLSEAIRESGLIMAIMVRYSTVPPHLTTAVFGAAGMSVWTFLLAAFLALPKQLATVYIGTTENSGQSTDDNDDNGSSKHTKIIKIVIIAATIVITMAAMRFVNAKIDGVKHRVIYARRKARQAKLSATGRPSDSTSNWSASPKDDVEARVAPAYEPTYSGSYSGAGANVAAMGSSHSHNHGPAVGHGVPSRNFAPESRYTHGY